jgi:hypothetical protein
VSGSKEIPFYQYNRAAGMSHADAAHGARTSVIMTYALWFKLLTSLVIFGSFMFVVNHPMFAHATGFERMRLVAWVATITIALFAYFPLRAKSIIFWILYVIVLCLAVTLIVISS